MNVYIVHDWTAYAVFSTREYAERFADEKTIQRANITEFSVDSELKPEWRRLNAPIYIDKPWQERPREECCLTGDVSKRGKVEGFGHDETYIEFAERTRKALDFEQAKGERLLAESKASAASVANGHPRYESLFARDNFTSRRTTGHNLLDPESFITQGELDKGFTLSNSFRDFPTQEVYEKACRGYLTLAEVIEQGPRVFIAPKVSGKKSVWSVAQDW